MPKILLPMFSFRIFMVYKLIFYFLFFKETLLKDFIYLFLEGGKEGE